MKKTLSLLACLAPATALASVTDVKFTSRSIMNIAQTMPIDPTQYYLLNDYFIYDREEPEHCHKLKEKVKHIGKESRCSFNVFVWGGATTNHADMAKYMLPFGKTELLVREGYANGPTPTNTGVDVPGNQDIVAENFNISTVTQNFCSRLTFKPKQTVIGVGFSGYAQLTNKIWVSFEAPLVHMKNTLDMVETVTFNGGGAVVPTTGALTQGFNGYPFYGNMTEAFSSPHMLYGKIAGSQSKTAFAYVNLKLGYTYLHEENRSAHMYGGLILPTGNKPKSRYLFEPLIGNNKHFGLLLGSYFTRRYNTKRFAINVAADSNTQFLFPNTQVRSIDLAGKPWSRYLGIYANDTFRNADASTEVALGLGNSQMRYQTWGINYLTQEVKVNPHFSTDLLFHISFELPRNAALDFGFRALWQQDEHVQLKNPWILGPMIGKLSSATTANPAECAPTRGINNMYATVVNATAAVAPNITSNPIYITEDQLDLTSATQPFRSDYTIYAATHRIFDTKKIDNCVLQLGTSYTFGSNNATANRWQVWLGASRYF